MALHPKFSSLLRVVLLVAAATAHHYSSTPPTAGSESEKALVERNAKASRKTFVGEKTSTDGKQEDEVAALPEPVLHDLQLQSSTRWTLRVVSWSRYFIWAVTALEGTTRILSFFSTSSISTAVLPILMPSLASPDNPISFPPSSPSAFSLLISPLTPTFVVSAVSVISGYRIRKACYDTLGRLFTFSHTTLSDHQLVTGGPYAVVRHPSYVGTVLVRTGMICALYSSGSWARSVGAVPWPSLALLPWEADTAGGIFVGTMRIALGMYAVYVVCEQIYLLARAPKEDRTLQLKFGVQWEEYRKRVPWMFIPHIV